MRRAATHCDAWHPLALGWADLEKGIAAVNELATRAGRPKGAVRFAPRNRLASAPRPPAPSATIQGNADQVAADMNRPRELECDWLTFECRRPTWLDDRLNGALYPDVKPRVAERAFPIGGERRLRRLLPAPRADVGAASVLGPTSIASSRYPHPARRRRQAVAPSASPPPPCLRAIEAPGMVRARAGQRFGRRSRIGGLRNDETCRPQAEDGHVRLDHVAALDLGTGIPRTRPYTSAAAATSGTAM